MFFIYLGISLALVYYYITWHYAYWKRHGFAYVKPSIPFGVLEKVLNGQLSFGMAVYDVYKNSREKVVGVFICTRPALLVRDAQLAHDIQSKDFNSFHDRGVYVDEENDPMSASLFALKGKKWKTLRNTLSPAFTTGKLKAMFATADDIGNKMIDHLKLILPEVGSQEVELKKVTATYAIDIIASVIFGLDVNSFKDPKNDFKTISDTVNIPTFKSKIRGTVQFLYPTLETIFVRLGWIDDPPEAMRQLVRRTIDIREKQNITRRDLLQLLLQLRNQGEINANDEEWETKTGGFKLISTDIIASQLFLFFVAGYETTAATISFTLYELAQNAELLEKAQKDVEAAVEKHGNLSYDALQDMKFMDLCISETIRKYPALPILNRICTEDFPIPDSDKVIKKGTPILISLYGIQRDEKYFEEPLKYDPERFLEENKNYNPAAYMPFGLGPRNCIGQRMGKLNAKIGLAKILTNFNIEINKPKEIEIDNYGVAIMPKGGVNVRLSNKKTKAA